MYLGKLDAAQKGTRRTPVFRPNTYAAIPESSAMIRSGASSHQMEKLSDIGTDEQMARERLHLRWMERHSKE